jgi:hypothetical protein
MTLMPPKRKTSQATAEVVPTKRLRPEEPLDNEPPVGESDDSLAL